jgi:hypothetical protein
LKLPHETFAGTVAAGLGLSVGCYLLLSWLV